MKESIIKKAMPDGKVAVTLFCDPEVANELFKMARDMSIEVIDAGEQKTVTKSDNKSGAYSRVAEIAKSKPVKEVSLTDRLIEKIKQK